jgi:exo-beta-1,3-glucanase (GH17 family)
MIGRLRIATWLFGVFYTILFIIVLIWFYQSNQPKSIAVPSLDGGKVQCVSYAPYYGKGKSPFAKGMWISQEQIDFDLIRLSKISDCIRTYSVGQGMDYVPEAASKVGLKVYLGAWIGWTDQDNVAEVNLAVTKANLYPETIKALIIGNEVLLRNEQDEQALQRYISLAKRQTTIPITYADVWEYWIKHKRMEKYVDFVTVHILPYWEDDPVAIDNAPNHAEKIMARLASIFSKPVLIGETGWPSVGRQRDVSAPGLLNQARYVREFLQKADEKKWQYNLIEAIDQPWKRVLEGTVGGYWGILNVNLDQKFSFTEPVAERQDRKGLMYLCVASMSLFLAIAYKLKQKSIWIYMGLASLGGMTSLTAWLQYEYLLAAARDLIEWFALGGLAIVGVVLALIQLWWLSRPSKQLEFVISSIRRLFLYSAIIASYLIATDGRYRDFPNILFALPISILSFGLWFGFPIKSSENRLHLWLCVLAVFIATYCWMQEVSNVSAMIWLCLNLVLALAHWPVKDSSIHYKSH